VLGHFEKYKTSPTRAVLKDEVLKGVKDEDKILYGGALIGLGSVSK
jgi:hypothetical protein